MVFWAFMLLCELLCPAAMVLFGHGFMTHPPKRVNHVYGYRTGRSMKNQETWEFAHAHCGKLWRRIGLWMLPLTVLAHLFLLGKSMDAVGIGGSVIVVLQIVVMVSSVVPTERALKRTFDEQGNRRT